MKYCFEYYSGIEKVNDNHYDEIKIILEEERANKKVLHDFVKRFSSHRIILKVTKPTEFLVENKISWLEGLEEYEIAIEICANPDESSKDLVERLKQLDISFFYADPAFTYETIAHYIELGVSDIYLSGTPAFNIKRVGDFLHNKGITVRIIPNIVQKQWHYLNGQDDLTSFFILPKDLKLYEPYVDVIEFWTKKKKSQKLLYDIYENGVAWIGSVNELIIDAPELTMKDMFIPTVFGEARTKCCQECLIGGPCRICYEIQALAKSFDKE